MSTHTRMIVAVAVALSTLSGCSKQCFESDKCKEKGKAGQCMSLARGYYFDRTEHKCKEFIWGGCDGVRPFATMEECVNSCHCD